jgi:hypothetical protein
MVYRELRGGKVSFYRELVVSQVIVFRELGAKVIVFRELGLWITQIQEQFGLNGDSF